MVHAVECIREGFFGSQMNAHYDLVYMAKVNLVMTLLGLVQTKRISLRVIPE
jgi:ABC-2 type transport system permease protein/capsular polysaccharide transport system permease protein